MLTYSADLNELGNPRIYGTNLNTAGNAENPLVSRFIVEDGTTNIVIYITPTSSTPIDKVATETTNSIAIAGLLSQGYILEIEETEQRIKISGNSILNTSPKYSDTFDSESSSDIYLSLPLFDDLNQPIEVHTVSISKNRSIFRITQTPCTDCLNFTYIDCDYDFQNPIDSFAIAQRGTVEYQQKDGSWISLGVSSITPTVLPGGGSHEHLTAPFTYCYCDSLENVEFRAIRTLREIPNCGGTSPIIYQSISKEFLSSLPKVLVGGFATKLSTIPYTPIITYNGSFNCCFPEDRTIQVNPTNLVPNNSSPHDGGAVTLKYDFYKMEGSTPNDLILTPQGETLRNTESSNITVTQGSTQVTVDSGVFNTLLIKGSKLFTDTGILIGTVELIQNPNLLTLAAPATTAYTGEFGFNKFYYPTPTTSTGFTFADLEQGTYKLVATYSNTCSSVVKEYTINVCGTYLVVTGDCNNPKIQNLSSTGYINFTLTTYNSMDVVDSVSQSVILKNISVSPVSSYQFPKLNDGFYKLTVRKLDDEGELISTDERILFYDCDIKSCEVALRSELLGFDFCTDCVDKKANLLAYQELERRNFRFQIQKEIIYSYWDDIKYQQAIPDTWNIEDHTQELQTYTEALNKLKTICADCGFTYSTNAVPLYSTGDCGCSK